MTGLRAVSPADRRPFLLAAVLFFTGALVLEKAQAAGLGNELPENWFAQTMP